MIEYLEQYGTTEQDKIRKTIQALLRQNCILKVKYDAQARAPKDNEAYQICARHMNFIKEYLDVLGCELIQNPIDGIFYLSGEGLPTEHLGLVETKLLILLKVIYHDKIMGEGLLATTTTLAEIREYGMRTGLITDKVKNQVWYKALGIMKVHQIIELPAAIRNLEDEMTIYIYPTINLFCTSRDMEMLINEYKKGEGNDTDEEMDPQDLSE